MRERHHTREETLVAFPDEYVDRCLGCFDNAKTIVGHETGATMNNKDTCGLFAAKQEELKYLTGAPPDVHYADIVR